MLRKQFKSVAMISTIIGVFFLLRGVYDYFKLQHTTEGIMMFIYAALLFIVGLIYLKKAQKVDCSIEVLDDIFKYQQLVIQKEVTYFNQYLIFSKDGAFLGRYKPNITGIRSFVLANIENFIRSMPFEHIIENSVGKPVLYIDTKGFNQQTFVIYDKERNKVGHIQQKLFQSVMHFVFEIEVENERFTAKSETLTKDMKVDGMFKVDFMKVPLELTETFKTLTPVLYQLDYSIENDKGKVGLALSVIYEMLKGR